jgi:cobalt/nickel transport system permease protein
MTAIPKAGIVSSALFVASLIHVNLGVSSMHLILNGLGGMLLGWALFPALFVALLLQAVLFQFGGLVVLGVNVSTMGVSGFLAGMLSRYVLRRIYSPVIAGFIAGAGGVAGAAILTAMALRGSGEFFLPTAELILVAHVPIIIIEGIICSFVCSFICITMPGFLEE